MRKEPFTTYLTPEVGIAWHTRKSWERLLTVADDRAALDDTFEDWERNALNVIRNLKAKGSQVRKVPIDTEALIVWCRESGRRIDGAARADYVTHLMQSAQSPGKR
jgi:hypothetical protein